MINDNHKGDLCWSTTGCADQLHVICDTSSSNVYLRKPNVPCFGQNLAESKQTLRKNLDANHVHNTELKVFEKLRFLLTLSDSGKCGKKELVNLMAVSVCLRILLSTCPIQIRVRFLCGCFSTAKEHRLGKTWSYAGAYQGIGMLSISHVFWAQESWGGPILHGSLIPMAHTVCPSSLSLWAKTKQHQPLRSVSPAEDLFLERKTTGSPE